VRGERLGEGRDSAAVVECAADEDDRLASADHLHRDVGAIGGSHGIELGLHRVLRVSSVGRCRPRGPRTMAGSSPRLVERVDLVEVLDAGGRKGARRWTRLTLMPRAGAVIGSCPDSAADWRRRRSPGRRPTRRSGPVDSRGRGGFELPRNQEWASRPACRSAGLRPSRASASPPTERPRDPALSDPVSSGAPAWSRPTPRTC
jgi:hypothetical protein